MSWPVLISVAHGGHVVPPEVAEINLLTPDEIIRDGDEGAAEIYAVQSRVQGFVSTDVARAYVDMNRSEGDRRKDGVVKTHTCWDVPIYQEPLSEGTIELLLEKYYRPYHEQLRDLAGDVQFGMDCHTMAAVGPPVGPDAGRERPLICLSNADGTFPTDWLEALRRCFGAAFEADIAVNDPFTGGYIIRAHSREIPWVQVEISRTGAKDAYWKKSRFLEALASFCVQLRMG